MNNKSDNLFGHFNELRTRMMWCLALFLMNFILCYFFAETIYNFLLQPLLNANNGENKKIIYTGLTEAFFTYLKLAYYGSLCLTIPIIFINIYQFLAPGLYKKEKKLVAPLMVASPVLFVLGMALVYYLIMPMAWQFFLSFENKETIIPIALEARISEYLSLIVHLMLAFGLAFQLPIILILLVKFNILTVESLRKKRRLAVVIIFAIAAIITPPDVISQIGLAIPLILLYEVSIFASRALTKEELTENA